MTDEEHFPEFDTYDATQESDRKIGFKIGGETFRCLPKIPASALLGISRDQIVLEEALDFFDRVLATDDEVKRFRALLDSKERIVEMGTLRDVFFHLLAEYGQRPTKRSSGSSGGPTSNGAGSTEDASSPESTQLDIPSTGR